MGDGWPAGGEWQAAGGIKFGSLEVTEVRFPLFFRTHEFRPGDRFVLESGGGGGWGDPTTRAPAATSDDIANGFVSQVES